MSPIANILEHHYGSNDRVASIVTIGSTMYVEMYDDEILVDMVDIPSKSSIEYARSIAEKYCAGDISARIKHW